LVLIKLIYKAFFKTSFLFLFNLAIAIISFFYFNKRLLNNLFLKAIGRVCAYLLVYYFPLILVYAKKACLAYLSDYLLLPVYT